MIWLVLAALCPISACFGFVAGAWWVGRLRIGLPELDDGDLPNLSDKVVHLLRRGR